MSARAWRAGLVGASALVVGALVPFGGARAPASAVELAREIVPPAQRVATTAAPFPYGGNYYGWASLNWSGYAVTAGPYDAVAGQWVVPTVTAAGGPASSSAWAGIGGFDTADLIQVGTEQDAFHHTTTYHPWWTTSELGYVEQTTWAHLLCQAPCSTTPSTFTVKPADTVQATIQETGTDLWRISLLDLTTGVGGMVTGVAHTASGGVSGGDSAEWILERPSLVAPSGAAHTAKLAKFSTMTFDPGTVNDGASPGLVAGATASDAGVMVQGGLKVIAVPSGPDGDVDGFNVAYGGVAPTPPTG